MRTTTAYFAGVGTVVAAVAVGLGSGLLISNIVSPHEPKTEMSKLELRMSSKPIPATNNTSEPVPYVEPSQVVPAAANEAQAQPNAAQPEPPAATPPAETAAANPPPPPDAAPAAQPAPREQAAAPENAFARTRDADLKRATERRKTERRQQWTERRRHRQDQELRDVEERVREETEPRQAFTTEPVRLEMPRIKLFDPE